MIGCAGYAPKWAILAAAVQAAAFSSAAGKTVGLMQQDLRKADHNPLPTRLYIDQAHRLRRRSPGVRAGRWP